MKRLFILITAGFFLLTNLNAQTLYTPGGTVGNNTTNGYVGIGKTPSYLLDVDGTINGTDYRTNGVSLAPSSFAYYAFGLGSAGWIRIASLEYNCFGTISISNSYYNNRPAPVTFSFSLTYRNDGYLSQLAGTNEIFTQARIVYPTSTDDPYYLEVYCNSASVNNTYYIALSNSFNATLYQSYTAGTIPGGYGSNAQPFIIGQSTKSLYVSANVGIGTTAPQSKLHICSSTPDNIGLTIQGNTINIDTQPHYVGIALDGDYGNGTGNSSQIRSYSNLYSQWGSSLAFYTTATTGNNLLERIRIATDGSVGIGTTSPTSILHVKKDQAGYTYIMSDNTYTAGSGVGSGFANVEGGNIVGFFRSERDGSGVQKLGNPYNSPLVLSTNGADRITILGGGNVLIGKTTQQNPAYKLDVEGKIRANEVVVNTSGADFVFTPDYKLLTLPEVDLFIKENKHLPDLASASEMKENGMNVSEMQTKLLQKIEELTLYTIEQNSKLLEQEEINQKLERELNELKELIIKKLK